MRGDAVEVGKQVSITDSDLLQQFEACTLPRTEWVHQTHVRVAYLYLIRHAYDVAVEKMRTGIQRYNSAVGVVEGLHSGYHETMTQAWMRLIAVTIREQGRGTDSEDFCGRQPHLLQRTALRLFYSRERIMSPAAKRTFLEGDLTPLPSVELRSH
jgi:hypothetical protein